MMIAWNPNTHLVVDSLTDSLSKRLRKSLMLVSLEPNLSQYQPEQNNCDNILHPRPIKDLFVANICVADRHNFYVAPAPT
jgi:hypothetical protein